MAALLDRLQNTLPTSLPGSLTSTLSTTASGPFNAIVTGATGINGLALVKALTADSRFARVYACSRRPPPAADSVTHIPTDFLAPVEEIAGALGKAVGPNERIDYVFFATYKQEETEQANWDTNGRMLRSFLDAIESSGIAGRGLRRVVLTTGAKFYGVHLGPVKNPLEEDDGRVEGEGRPPNFYYHQEDIVKEKSAGQGWDWVVAMPNDIIGFARGNFMNIASALALYAAITAELGEELWFPGTEAFYLGFDTHSYAPNIADFELWAALEPRASNELFNVVNGDAASWQAMWPRLAARFGVRVPADQFARRPPQDTHASGPLAVLPAPPLAERAGAMGLAGTRAARAGYAELRVDLASWAARPEVKDAWARLAARENLDEAAFGEGTFGFANFVLGRSYSIVCSMSKARRLGWTGYVDTWEAYEKTFDELERERIIPARK